MGPMYHTYRTPPRAAWVRQGALPARGGERVAQRDVVRLTWWLPEGGAGNGPAMRGRARYEAACHPVPTLCSAPQIASARPPLSAALGIRVDRRVARSQDQGAFQEPAPFFAESRTLAGERLPPGGATRARVAVRHRHAATLLVCGSRRRSEEHTSELQSHLNLVCRLL